MKQHDLQYWQEMAERYFQAETSEQEEAMLRSFLCTAEARDSRFDEIRATLGFLCAGSRRSRRFPSLDRRLKVACIAACLGAIAFVGWYHSQRQDISSVRIAGKSVEADASALMQKQMKEMFSTQIQ